MILKKRQALIIVCLFFSCLCLPKSVLAERLSLISESSSVPHDSEFSVLLSYTDYGLAIEDIVFDLVYEENYLELKEVYLHDMIQTGDCDYSIEKETISFGQTRIKIEFPKHDCGAFFPSDRLLNFVFSSKFKNANTSITFAKLSPVIANAYTETSFEIDDLHGLDISITDELSSGYNLPPYAFDFYPGGPLGNDTTQVLLEFETNKKSDCRFSLYSGSTFDTMPVPFETDDGLRHTKLIYNLNKDNFYNLYYACRSEDGKTSDRKIFLVSVGPLAYPGTDTLIRNFEEYYPEADGVWSPNERVELDTVALALYSKFLGDIKQDLSSYKQTQYALARFIQHGTVTTKKLGGGERTGVVGSYFSAFNRVPYTVDHWIDVIKIANGRWPGERNLDREKEIEEIYFEKIYKRAPDMNNERDNAAVTIMTYGLRPANRNTDSEAASIEIFRAIFEHGPVSALDWDIVRAIAYSGASR